MTTAEYNQCVDNYSDGVYRFILKNLGDEDKAQDIVQDSFEKMWRKVNEISYEKARSYLFTTAYHTMIDAIRKEKHQQAINDSHLDTHGHSHEYTGLKEILDEALAQLAPIQRSLITLRDYEGYSYQEIGEITKLTESQVKVYIYRARVFLKNYIRPIDIVI